MLAKNFVRNWLLHRDCCEMKRSEKIVIIGVVIFILTYPLSPIFNSFQERAIERECKEDWKLNYESLERAYSDLEIGIWRPEEFLSNAYDFAGQWYEDYGNECFQNNPSKGYLNAFAVVLREYERQLSMGSQLSPPDLPFLLLKNESDKSHVGAGCYGWMFKSKERRCSLLFKLTPNGFYRAIVDDL